MPCHPWFIDSAGVPEIFSDPWTRRSHASNFFAEFGSTTTTFVLSAELYPVNLRTTDHGLSAGIAKVGAFNGVFLFPTLEKALGVSGTLTITAGFAGFCSYGEVPCPPKQTGNACCA